MVVMKEALWTAPLAVGAPALVLKWA
jgi:hypothetical protein